MFATTANRVSSNTADYVNRRIRRETAERIRRYGRLGPRAISRRLAQLDAEWDIERYLETMAPSITLLGLTLGVTVTRKWLAIPFVVQAFLLEHALQGWCPPLEVCAASACGQWPRSMKSDTP